MMRPMTEWKPVEHLSDDVRRVELQQRDEVKIAAQEFTSFFLSHLMQQQRKTIDTSDLMDGGQGEKMFTGLLDQEYGKKLAMREDGINRMLINDWARGLGGYATTAARSIDIPSIRSDARPVHQLADETSARTYRPQVDTTPPYLHSPLSILKAYGDAR